jgi:hypothetical protein
VQKSKIIFQPFESFLTMATLIFSGNFLLQHLIQILPENAKITQNEWGKGPVTPTCYGVMTQDNHESHAL